MVSVVLGGDVVLDLPVLGACDFLHLAYLRHAQLGVIVEEHAAVADGQLVLGPVPQLPEVLVVQGVEGVVPGEIEGDTHTHTHTHTVEKDISF